MINNLPTIFEVLNVSSKKLSKERTPNSFSRSNKPRLKVHLTLYSPVQHHLLISCQPTSNPTDELKIASPKVSWKRRRGRRRRRRRARKHIMRRLRQKLRQQRVLDLLRRLRAVVSWEMCQGNSCNGWAYQAIQVPGMQQQKGERMSRKKNEVWASLH